MGVKCVVIPIEETFPCALYLLHEGVFHIVEHIEPNESHSLTLPQIVVQGSRVLPQALHHLPVEYTYIESSLGLECLLQSTIEGKHVAPHMQKAFLDDRITFGGEVAEELPECFFLFRCQIVQMFQAVLVIYVGEHQTGICHVLVDIIEVREDYLSPSP